MMEPEPPAGTISVELPLQDSSLAFRDFRPFRDYHPRVDSLRRPPWPDATPIPAPAADWAWTEIELTHNGERLVLGGDEGTKIKANFVAGLDARMKREPSGRSHPVLGPNSFYFQGLASTSMIIAGYQPTGALRLLILGSQVKHELEVLLDLSPRDRAEWRRRVREWRVGPIPDEC